MSEILTHQDFCERMGPEFWGEPVNTFSSLGFLIVAAQLYRYYRTHPDLKGSRVWDLHILTVLIVAIGLGSFLYHTIPNRWTNMADVVPIVIFINLYFFSALMRITKCTKFETIVCYIAFVGFSHIFVSQFPHALNNSIGYLSSMASLVVIAFYLNMKRRTSARSFLVIALTGILSLFFRAVDEEVCELVPLGTHFLWHVFNSMLLYMLMIQLIRNVNREARIRREVKEKMQRDLLLFYEI